jgi:hypothetical protein
MGYECFAKDILFGESSRSSTWYLALQASSTNLGLTQTHFTNVASEGAAGAVSGQSVKMGVESRCNIQERQRGCFGKNMKLYTPAACRDCLHVQFSEPLRSSRISHVLSLFFFLSSGPEVNVSLSVTRA